MRRQNRFPILRIGFADFGNPPTRSIKACRKIGCESLCQLRLRAQKISKHGIDKAGSVNRRGIGFCCLDCLIDNGKNGFVYEFANVEQLTQILSMLVKNSELRCNVGKEAYKTLKSTWSAETAAERFYELCKALLAKGDGRGLYASGPCSPARILKNDWIKNTK